MKLNGLSYKLRPNCGGDWVDPVVKFIYIVLPVFLLSSIFFNGVFAATKTFTGTGNFSDATRWNGGTMPVAGDDLTVSGICTIDNNGGTDNVAYGNLIVGVAGGNILKWAVGGTNRLNIYSLDGIGTLDMTNGGTLIVREIIHNNFTFTQGIGTVERRYPTLNTTLPWTFNNLIINPGSGQVISTGIAINVTGNLTISSGTFSIGAFDLIVGGTTTINSASTLAITSATGIKSFKNLIVNGTFSNNSVVEQITISGNLTNNGTFNQGTGRITFTGAASNTITGTAAATAFGGGVTVNKGSTSANILDAQCVITMPSGGLTLTNGTFKLSSNSTIAPFLNSAAAIIPASAGLWDNGGTMNSPASMDWTVNGYLRCSGGTINIGTVADNLLVPASGSTIAIDGGIVNVTGRMDNYSVSVWDFLPFTFTMSGGTMNICTVGSTTPNWPPFSIGVSGSTFSMSGGTIVIVHPTDPGGANYGFYNLAGTYTVTGGTLQIGNGSTNAGEIIRINSTVPLYDLLINSANVTARLSPLLTTTIVVNHNLSIALGILDANDKNLKIGNNWTNNGIFLPTSTTVTFDGTFDGTSTVGGSSTTTFCNLTISTVTLADVIQLTNSASVNTLLTLTKGVLDLNSESLTVTNGLNSAITRTSGYILSEKTDNSSKLIWSIGNNLTSHTYPFGTSSGSYIPFVLNLTAGNIGNVTVSTYGTPVNNTPYPTTPILVTNLYAYNGADNSGNTVDRFWQIDKDGASGTATLTFTATAAEVGSILLPTAQRYETLTNKWQTPLPGQTSTSTSATVPGVTTFSPWTLSSQAAILPIQLVSFNAVYTKPFVSLTWVTESEINSDYFIIERTTDERTFETVCKVKAAGHSIQTLNYESSDKNPLPGLSYYRLKQVDMDGTASYSDLTAIEISKATDEIRIFPNPVTQGMITIKILNHAAETLEVLVTDLNGKTLLANTCKLADTESSIVINNLGILPKGLYLLKISGTSDIFNQKIAIY